MEPGDDSGGHRLLEAERVPEHDGEASDPRERALELGRRQPVAVDADDREIGVGIGRGDAAGHPAAVGERDVDMRCSGDHVVVGENRSVRPVDHPAADALLPAAVFGEHGDDRRLSLLDDVRDPAEPIGGSGRRG